MASTSCRAYSIWSSAETAERPLGSRITCAYLDRHNDVRADPCAINEERVREAAEIGAETLGVSCPFCTLRGCRAR